MFKINHCGTGFIIQFNNGYAVSIQFGPGTYSDNHGVDDSDWPHLGRISSSVAEAAIVDPECNIVQYEYDKIQRYQSPEDVLKILNYAASLSK